MDNMRSFINMVSGSLNRDLGPKPSDNLKEAEKTATCGCTSGCNHCGDNHTVDQIGENCECCGNEIKAIKKEAVGDFAEPIYDLIDELGDSSIVLDNLIRYLDGDTIKDFVSDFRRHHDMNNTEESTETVDAESVNESVYLDKVNKLLG